MKWNNEFKCFNTECEIPSIIFTVWCKWIESGKKNFETENFVEWKSNEFRSIQQIVNWQNDRQNYYYYYSSFITSIYFISFHSLVDIEIFFIFKRSLANVKERERWLNTFSFFFIWQSKWIESNWNDIGVSDKHWRHAAAAEWKPNCVGGKSEEEKKFCFFDWKCIDRNWP